MTANSRTWFYTEPEHRPYYIEERVNQNLWASRFGSIYLDCVRAEPPFRMEGNWNDISIVLEWVPNKWLKLITSQEDRTLISGFAQVLQFNPTVTYTDEDGLVYTEWWRGEGDKRMQEIEGRAMYTNVRTYK
ncbi:MAG: hypothetical protein U0528_07955 [Anaerolineae bacterium]|nr:hypothetical protein [Anaerolineae bacterium]